jgi:chromosome partitioning protein
MRVWTVISQKGGSGRSTLILHMAAAAAQSGLSVLVIDLDPQGSAERWVKLRKSDNPAVVAGEVSHLDAMLEAAKGAGADLVIIDTAPRMEAAAVDAAKRGDVIIITSRPTLMDIPAALDTLEMASLEGLETKRKLVVINSVIARTQDAADTTEVFTEQGALVCPQTLGERIEFRRSLSEGKGVTEYNPKSKAADEIRAVYAWIERNSR